VKAVISGDPVQDFNKGVVVLTAEDSIVSSAAPVTYTWTINGEEYIQSDPLLEFSSFYLLADSRVQVELNVSTPFSYDTASFEVLLAVGDVYFEIIKEKEAIQGNVFRAEISNGMVDWESIRWELNSYYDPFKYAHSDLRGRRILLDPKFRGTLTASFYDE